MNLVKLLKFEIKANITTQDGKTETGYVDKMGISLAGGYVVLNSTLNPTDESKSKNKKIEFRAIKKIQLTTAKKSSFELKRSFLSA